MKVHRIILTLTLIHIIIVSSQEEIDDLVIYEKIDRAGKVQDGGEEDLGKIIEKSVNENLAMDEELTKLLTKLV
jgi:hypothetical protein